MMEKHLSSTANVFSILSFLVNALNFMVNIYRKHRKCAIKIQLITANYELTDLFSRV